MSYIIECRKIRRTGLILTFFGGGLLAALIPVLNMAFRSEMYITQNEPPLQILFDANWQIMAMLNILLIVSGACALYHIEYGDNAIQKMAALPLPGNSLFLGKCLVLRVLAALMLLPEILSLVFCIYYWFSGAEILNMAFYREIFAGYGYLLLLMLPLILIALLHRIGLQKHVDFSWSEYCLRFYRNHAADKQFCLVPFSFRPAFSDTGRNGWTADHRFYDLRWG